MADSTLTEAPIASNMEIENVLKQYLSLFGADCRQFKVYMAPNAVVDWFGRTIRGHSKIQDYLRNEVNSEYEHANFEKVQSCAPIEYKPTHMKTKTTPIGDIDYVLPKNRVTGITSLKTRAESDVEDNDDGNDDLGNGNDVDMLPLTPEPPQQEPVTVAAINSSAVITPPTSTTKVQPSDCDTESDTEDEPKSTAAKRFKRSHPSLFSYMRRPQATTTATATTATKRKLVNETGMRAFLLDESTNDAEANRIEGYTCEYSPLRYFETTGVLRAQNQSKYMELSGGGGGTPYKNDGSSGSDNSWDRPVRMRISYRRHLKDKQIQFALIIYEHLDKSAATGVMSTRRNLMLEFSQLAGKNGDDDEYSDDDDEDIQVIVEHQDMLSDASFLNSNLSNQEFGETGAASVMTTPTKLGHTPPATPKRRSRLPQSLSSIKRYNAQSSSTATSPSPKRSAARSLRL